MSAFLQRLIRAATVFIVSKAVQNNDVQSFSKLVQLPQDASCVEVGCGDGYSLELIFDLFRPASLIGLDINEANIKKANTWIKEKELGQVIQAMQGDAIQLPFQRDSCDAVFLFATLHHIANWRKAIEEISRVLKPGGLLLFKEPTSRAFMVPFIKWIDGPTAIFKEQELRDALGERGFEIMQWTYRGWYKKFLKVSIAGVCRKNRSVKNYFSTPTSRLTWSNNRAILK